MNSRKTIRTIFILTILLSNIGCDQVSKSIVRENIGVNDRIFLLNNHVTLMKVENTGAFLSLGNSMAAPLRLFLLAIIPVLILTYSLWLLFSKINLSKGMRIGIACVIGGGVGNIYDRLAYGSVTDFMHIDFGIFQTGVFNMADVSIMIGMLLIIASSHQKNHVTS